MDNYGNEIPREYWYVNGRWRKYSDGLEIQDPWQDDPLISVPDDAGTGRKSLSAGKANEDEKMRHALLILAQILAGFAANSEAPRTDCETLYITRISQALTASTSECCRENHLMENLAYQHGSKAQVLRILWWGSEAEPLLRKELLRQWINDCRPTPDAAEVRKKFLSLTEHFAPAAREARSAEIEEVLRLFSESPEKMRVVKGEGCWVELNTGIPALDYLDENALFSPGSKQWQEMIRALPECHDLEGGDVYNGGVYLHLWTIAPPQQDEKLEKKLTEQALKTFPPLSRHRLLPWVMEERLRELPGNLKAKRTIELEAAKGRSRK